MREDNIHNFWTEFHNYLKDNHIDFCFYENKGEYGGLHWCKVNDKTPGFRGAPFIGVDLVNRNHFIRANVYIPNDKDFYDSLFAEKSKIEKKYDGELQWARDCGKYASRIFIEIDGLNYHNKSNYPALFKELADTLEHFITAFESKLLNYKKQKIVITTSA